MIRKITALTIAALLVSCGPNAPADKRSLEIDACERRLGRMLPDTAKGAALCSCLVDGLAREGLEFTDILSPHRERVEAISQSCARQVGVEMPGQ